MEGEVNDLQIAHLKRNPPENESRASVEEKVDEMHALEMASYVVLLRGEGAQDCPCLGNTNSCLIRGPIRARNSDDSKLLFPFHHLKSVQIEA
jgi:hypothetical protein